MAEKNQQSTCGYTIVPDIIWKTYNLDLQTAYLYGYLLRLSQKYGYCFATNRSLADFMNVSISSIARHLKVLKENGLIEIRSATGINGYSRQRHIYVIDYKALSVIDKLDSKSHTCTDDLVADATYKNTSQEYKNYVSQIYRYGIYKNVFLTEYELDLLCSDLGDQLAYLMICALSEEISATGRVYKSHYNQIRSEYTRNIKRYASPNSEWIRKTSVIYQEELKKFLSSREAQK